MKGIIKIIAYTELVLGIIGSFLLAKELGKIGSYFDKHAARDWGLTLTTFIVGVISSFIGFAILYALFEILDNQEELLKKINLTASQPPTRLTAAIPQSSPFVSPSIPSSSALNGWKCSKCGQVNASYVGTCGCGNAK